MRRSKLMLLSRDQHMAQLERIISPDQRAAYYKAFVDPTPVDLATAENLLLVPFLQQNAFANLGPVGLNTIEYPLLYPYDGGSEILDSVASFLTTQWNVPVSSDNMYGSSGVIAALEVIALALFNPGDEVLVPAPMFYGFPWSFSQKTVAMQFIPFQIDGGVDLTAANVATALQQNPNARLLVLTNPNNPLGVNYPKELLEEIYALFLSNPNRHIISDEIYACSQVGDSAAFVSALGLNAYAQFPDQIHVTWGLSKDFGLAGFRAGFLISNAAAVQTALSGGACGPIPSWYASEAWFSPFVTLNPYMLQKLFFNAGAPDPTMANQAMVVYKDLLLQQYNATAQLLTQGGIPYLQGNTGAIFFWIDLSAYLDLVPASVPPQPPLCAALYADDDIRERRLATYLSNAGVLLVRGQECFNTAPGFFRLCYTAAPLDQLTTGITNMVAALQQLQP
jgi:aspartate/methionine/tyrosine aminotransferase